MMYEAYVNILKEELVPAAGCTEPIAVTYCAASAQHILGKKPQHVLVQVSGNILKNVKSVFVPNTGGLRGIEAATAAGIVVNRADRQLEILSEVTPQQQQEIQDFLQQVPIHVELAPGDEIFDIIVTLETDTDRAQVRIQGNRPYHRQCAGHCFRHRVRWRQGQLCGKDCLCCGRRYFRLAHVSGWTAISGWRRHCHQGCGKYHLQRGPSGT